MAANILTTSGVTERCRLRICVILPVILTLGAPMVPALTREPNLIQSHVLPAPSRLIHPKEPDSKRKLLAIKVEFEMKTGDEGVLIAGGDDSESFSLEVRSGRLTWIYHRAFREEALIIVSGHLPAGSVTVRYEFGPEQGADIGRHRQGRMVVNGTLVEGPGTLTSRCFSDSLPLERSFTGIIRRVSLDEIPPQ